MKTINLQGKQYVQVVERLKHFNQNFKDHHINTSYEIVNGNAIFRAEIINPDGKIVATGTGMKPINKEFNLEKCETRAIGRALGIFGIGADNSISTYDEVKEAISQEPETPNKNLIERAKIAFNAIPDPTDKQKEFISQIDHKTNQQIMAMLNAIQKNITKDDNNG